MKKIIKTKPASWQGNGFGTAPAYYAVQVDGNIVATITHGGLVGDSHAWGVYAEARTLVSPTGWMTYREARAWALDHADELATRLDTPNGASR